MEGLKETQCAELLGAGSDTPTLVEQYLIAWVGLRKRTELLVQDSDTKPGIFKEYPLQVNGHWTLK